MGVIYPQKFTSGTRPPANSGLLLWTLFLFKFLPFFLESFFKTTQQTIRGGGGTSGAYPEELNASRLVPYGGPPPRLVRSGQPIPDDVYTYYPRARAPSWGSLYRHVTW